MNPVTPMRHIPGAYIQTPAPAGQRDPVRRKLNFGDTTTSTGHSSLPLTSTMRSGQTEIVTAIHPPSQPPREDLPPVSKAALVVNQTLQLDDSYPDIDSYCRRMYLLLDLPWSILFVEC